MQLTAKVRLYPTAEQEKQLLDTLDRVNAACNALSEWAWENKTFGKFALQKERYHAVKDSFELTAQATIHAVRKVSYSYKLDRKTQCTFRPLGSITYDSRILSWKPAKQTVSIWTVGGRQTIPYRTGEHHGRLLAYQKGESDLCLIKGKWYLHSTCEVPDTEEQLSDDVLGVDLGITNIATDDSGQPYQGKELNALRHKRQKVRSSLQSKGTKGAKRVLKRLSGRERTTTKITNHTIAKDLVAKAKKEQKAICLEELTGIRARTNKRLRKAQRGLHNRWSFHQLLQYIAYKSEREGVAVYYCPPAYTSKTCHCCKRIGKRSGEIFNCTDCGVFHADVNAAENIRSWGRFLARPENSTLYCSLEGSACASGLNPAGFSRVDG